MFQLVLGADLGVQGWISQIMIALHESHVCIESKVTFAGFPKGEPLWGPYNKAYSVSGSILGSPYLGKLPSGM